MIYKVIDIPTTNADFKPILTAYLPSNSPEIVENKVRKTIVICPGGGYRMTSDREAEPVALKFAGEGYNVFVLRYSVAPARYPTAIIELTNAVAHIRKNAKEYNVDTNNVIVCGFSAGGHLAANLGTYWHSEHLENLMKSAEYIGDNQGELTKEDYKPNGLLLCYPVVSGITNPHQGSFNNLLGENNNIEMLNMLSLETKVTKNMPPAFIWHTSTDQTVDVTNSINLANAMSRENVSLELHIFNVGGHGLSLANENTAKSDNLVEPTCEVWIDLFLTWLKNFNG